MRTLITGATGFVGGRLARALAADGVAVRALVRDRGRARPLEQDGIELHEGDVTQADSLAGAGDGVDIAYYLVHGMGRGSDDDFAERERDAARNFARMPPKREWAAWSTWAGWATTPTPSICAAATRPRRSSPSTARRSPTCARRWWSAPRASPTRRFAIWSSACP